MKAFFSRLHIGSSTKEKDRESPILQKEKFPPLRQWPPPESVQRSTSTPTSFTSTPFKPLPELVPTYTSKTQDDHSSSSTSTPTPPYSSPTPTPSRTDGAASPSPARNGAASPLPARSNSPRAEPDSAGRSSRKTNTSVATATASDVQKKVAFRSPPPTPSNLDRTLPEAPGSTTASGVPLKTSVTRFQAVHGKEPRGSTSTGASSSRTDVASSAGKTAVKSTSTRTTSPYLQKVGEAGSSQSLRSGTPYSSMSNNTSGSRILAAQSWSEVTEEDLVSNLGSRERTRQEVLFEIISSEERYVQELIKMKDTFIDPLLHPYSAPTPQLSSTPNLDFDYYRAESPAESNDHLPPIAARFMSPSPTIPPPDTPPSSHKDTTPNIDGESLDTDEEDEGGDQMGKGYGAGRQGQLAKQNHPRSPYRSTVTKPGGKSVPFPSRSHHSLPPPPRNAQLNGSTHSLGRQSSVVERERNYSQGQTPVVDRKGSTPKPGMLRKFKKSQTTSDNILGVAVAPHQLPDDLRICLEVVDSGVFDGHRRLSEALKKRYDDQFPLVRSLADVFVSNSDIFQGYATYVLHLERALEQVDDALSNVSNKKPKKQDVGEWQKVCKVLQKLEENASEKGETGLAITLSKPFQRLLKYPLLFQNLLFHTDPSTFEYESTLQMVAEVETIVRSIEDEKIQKEERDKTRDVFARIEGLDKVRQLALPKPSRVLIEERQYTPPGGSGLSSPPKSSSPPPAMNNSKGVRGKSSFKRLSDVLHTGSSIGGKKDLWLVVFNDVVLQCQRTGTTSLPLVAATYSRTNSLPELQGRTKYATTGRRNSHTKPRNLYKFLKIETWAIGDVVQPREGLVSMEDVARSRAQVHQPRIVPMPDDDEEREMDSDDSDRKSKMSFSYWGADKITVQKPVIKTRTGPAPRRGGAGSSYGRESSANAKFGTRLVSGDSSPTPRPASRRTAGTPTSRRPTATDDSNSNYAKSTITPARPEWNNNTRSPVPGATAVKPRPRNISQTSAAVSSTRLANAKGLASPAPSEDSGVGLYRQMLAKDPSLNNST
ncbi:DH domain-containing protein [Favolaschia claudopus]|uniref:DH domain-containing protein n=1 Tax=Favolaschia claudopus TaxID=2862362 RepID=A0AAW0ANU1_9AGAR